MSSSDRLLRVAFDVSSSSRNSVRQRTSLGWLIAATGATLLCGDGPAHSGPCTAQIAQLERQRRRGSTSRRHNTRAQCLGWHDVWEFIVPLVLRDGRCQS
jgi:hypothetical protein